MELYSSIVDYPPVSDSFIYNLTTTLVIVPYLNVYTTHLG